MRWSSSVVAVAVMFLILPPVSWFSPCACDNDPVLDPDHPLTPLLLGIVLVGLIGLLVLRTIVKDRREYQRFKNFVDTADRQRMFRRWLIESLALFGGSAVVIVPLVWQFIPRMLVEVYTYPWVATLRQLYLDGGALAAGVVWGAGIAIIIGTVVAVRLAARHTDEVPTVGDIGALLPRNRPELRFGFALSINAGIVEEVLFRLAVPALIYGITSNATVAIVSSVLLFGLLHAYQKVWGIVVSTVIGALLMLLYLGTGTIIAPIIAHILFDLRSLVLIPVVVYKVHDRVD